MADQRPTVATVFAVLHFVFGGLSAIVSLIAVFSILASIPMGIISLLSLAISILLIMAGVSLIGNKSNAIQLNKFYVISSISVQILSIIVTIAVLKGSFTPLSIVGLIYPILVFILIVNNKEVQNFYK